MTTFDSACRRYYKLATVVPVMQAIILAGGKGTRLRSVTKDIIPKHLVQLHHKPLLNHVIDHAITHSCDNIIICTGHLGHKIQEHIEKSRYAIPIKISQEET